ncbi:MAG: NADH-quinone oxidoreductase subunit H [Arcicella sp.]|nr:NADH-quinone oxidoreductase subunit H [Arcicella sp.]
MVSYEVSMGFILIAVMLLVAQSLNLIGPSWLAQKGVLWEWHAIAAIVPSSIRPRPAALGQCCSRQSVGLVMSAMLVMFFITALAETNRPPFDLPEAEAELVARLSGGIFVHALSCCLSSANMLYILLMCAR